MWETVALVLIVAGLAFWIDSLRARERALAAGRTACERNGLQLLDETVAGAGLRLARNDAGELRIRRVFVFEFSDNGNNRRRGSITVLGADVQDLYIEPYPVQ
ncbi:MAG TPA: DUF3301 domain-containing protein [Burkholderiales bacterium]|jgi:hypothetical protein